MGYFGFDMSAPFKIFPIPSFPLNLTIRVDVINGWLLLRLLLGFPTAFLGRYITMKTCNARKQVDTMQVYA